MQGEEYYYIRVPLPALEMSPGLRANILYFKMLHLQLYLFHVILKLFRQLRLLILFKLLVIEIIKTILSLLLAPAEGLGIFVLL